MGLGAPGVAREHALAPTAPGAGVLRGELGTQWQAACCNGSDGTVGSVLGCTRPAQGGDSSVDPHWAVMCDDRTGGQGMFPLPRRSAVAACDGLHSGEEEMVTFGIYVGLLSWEGTVQRLCTDLATTCEPGLSHPESSIGALPARATLWGTAAPLNTCCRGVWDAERTPGLMQRVCPQAHTSILASTSRSAHLGHRR